MVGLKDSLRYMKEAMDPDRVMKEMIAAENTKRIREYLEQRREQEMLQREEEKKQREIKSNKLSSQRNWERLVTLMNVKIKREE